MDKKFVDGRSNFGLSNKNVGEIKAVDSKDLFGREMPKVIEGAELYDALCPISKLTGKRTNPLSLLGMITGAKADVLQSILQQLPVVSYNPYLSDKDRANFVVERCSSGSPAEDALMAEKIMQDLDAIGLSYKGDAVKTSDSLISFEDTDEPKSE